MNFLDKLVRYVSPETAYRREFFRQELKGLERQGYDAGGYDRVNSNWRTVMESAEMTDRDNRDTLRARARDLERNSDMLNGVISAFVRNVVGGGFNLQAKGPDEQVNEQIEGLWREWCKPKNCDVTGQQGFNQLLRMAVRRKKVDGGVLFKKCYTEGGLLPFKLQALEVDELAVFWTAPHTPENKVAGGVEYNPYNRPVGYWVGQYSIDGMETAVPEYYPAEEIIFLYSKRRPSQIREISDMSPTLCRIRDANEFITAVSVKERIAACLAVFVKKAVPVSGFGRSGQPKTTSSGSYEDKRLTPGMISEMNAGDEIQVVDPKGSGSDASHFLKMQQRLIGCGQGLSYEATSRDMSEVNYSSARQGAIEDDLSYAEEVELLIDNLLDEVYAAFLDACVISGRVKIRDYFGRRDEFLRHYWVASPKRWIDPLKEANANRIALESGQKTYAQIAAEMGRDWRSQIDELAEVDAYAKLKGVQIGGEK